MVAYLADVRGADDPRWGGKGRGLARLAAAGLAVPPAFVVTDELFRALRRGGPAAPAVLDAAALPVLEAARAVLRAAPLPAGFEPALAAHLARLGDGGARFAVRSSFAAEDDAAALAPGVHESRISVAADQVPEAVRQVLASALSPGALAYARARGRQPAEPPVAVLVHRFVEGQAAGSAALDRAGAATPAITVASGQLPAEARRRIEEALAALAARHGPVEVEWVATGGGDGESVVFLQLRPYLAPPPPRPWPGLAELTAGGTPAGRWRWDAAHNPLPLSPAQAGLVELVDRSCRTGARLKVVGGGYLFQAPDGPAPRRAVPGQQARAAFDELRARAEAGLEALGPQPALEGALALFTEIYEPLFGVVQPAARAGVRDLESFLDDHLAPGRAHLPALLGGVESMATERGRRARRLMNAGSADRPAALAAYLTLFGDEAPVWDVAVPTYRERPPAPPPRRATAVSGEDRDEEDRDHDHDRRWRAAADRLFSPLPSPLRDAAERRLAVARACVAVGEDDDWLYARVQAAVRRALRALGGRLCATGVLAQPDDVFFWPLSMTRSVAAGGAPPPAARAIAAQARAALAAAQQDPPTAATGAASPPGDAALVRGSGTGGRVIGRVTHHHPHGGAPERPAAAAAAAGAGDGAPEVLVAHTLLPTELPLVTAAALVTESGGPLDHVAAQARERALPAVVGAAGATRVLQPGDLVLVDGDAGVVVRLGR